MLTKHSYLNGTSCFLTGNKKSPEVARLERRVHQSTHETYNILSATAGGLRLENTVMTCPPARGLPEWLALQGPRASVESGFEGMKRLPVHRYLHWEAMDHPAGRLMCLLPGVRTWCGVSSELLVLEPLGLIRTTRFNTSSEGQSFRMSKDSFFRQLSPQCGSECRDIMCARRQEPCLPRCATLLAVHISDAFVGTYRPSESLPDSFSS